MTLARQLLETYVSVVHADGSVSRKRLTTNKIPKPSRRLAAKMRWKHMSSAAKKHAVKSRLRAMKMRRSRLG